MMIKVSVIIPVYNTEKFLRRCLDSVCNQTLKDIEIICVNDASPDNSAAILAEYAARDPRMKVIAFEQNRGAAAARNAGIEAATGEYIGFVDSDDWPETDFYRRLYHAARGSNADAAKGDYRYADGNSPCFLNEVLAHHREVFSFAFCSAIFSRRVIERFGLRFPKLRDMEDPVFTLEFALHAESVLIVDASFVNITTREDSQSHGRQSLERIIDRIEGLRQIVRLATSVRERDAEAYGFLVAFWMRQTFVNSRGRTEEANLRSVAHALTDLWATLSDAAPVKFWLKRMDRLFARLVAAGDCEGLCRYDQLATCARLRRRMVRPSVSVVIPVYNAEKYLARCLLSVCMQSLDDFEVICVDDCSTDASRFILEDFSRNFEMLSVIRHPRNEGESAARNTGLAAAKGGYLAFVDNDDVIERDFLRVLYECAKAADADIAKGNLRIVGPNGKEKEGDLLLPMIERTGDKAYFIYHWWTALYRKRLFDDNGIRFPVGIPLGGDVLTLHHLAKVANAITVDPSVHYVYMRRTDSGDSAVLSMEKLRSSLNVFWELAQDLNRMYADRQLTAEAYVFSYKTWLQESYVRGFRCAGNDGIAECCQSARRIFRACLAPDEVLAAIDDRHRHVAPLLLADDEKAMQTYFEQATAKSYWLDAVRFRLKAESAKGKV